MSFKEILSVKDFSLSFNKKNISVPLVKKVGFSLQEHRITGLIGESGCGKSLTCLGIMGLLPENIKIEGGCVKIFGKDQARMTSGEKRAFRGRDIAMILQNPMSCFDSVFKIRNHFFETMQSHGEKNRRKILESSRKALLEVGFDNPDEILDLYPFQMSGGMLQRIMVAIALIMNVSILIADEPTTDLDLVSQGRILDLLEKMRDRFGMSILLVTHDLSVIARLADQVMVMKDGMIVESGDIKAIFEKWSHPYTGSLLNAHFSMYGKEVNNLLNLTNKNGVSQGEVYEYFGTYRCD